MPTSTSTIRCKRGAGHGSVVVPGRNEIELITLSQSLRDEGTGTRLPSEHWLERYHQVRNQTMDLVATLTPEDQMVQSMPDASPAKWHLAHTTWFFETFVLAPHVTGYLPYDERYGFLFNSYYKRLGHHPSRTTRGTFSRPTLDEVWSYRTHVDNIIRDLLDHGASPEVFRLLELGLNHEQQHQELIITDIKHAFWVNPVRPSYQPDQSGTPVAVEPASMPPLAWFCFDGGLHHIGHDGSGFAFDNELPRHTVFIEPFCIASRLVTNQEYQALHRGRRISTPGTVAIRCLGSCLSQRLGSAALLGTGRIWMDPIHLPGNRAVEASRTSLPRQFL